MTFSQHKNKLWLVLLFVVVCSNIALYQTTMYEFTGADESQEVVLGSLIDLLIVMPILFFLYYKKFTWKLLIGLVAIGCIIAKFAIPSQILEPFAFITTGGLLVEVTIIAIELILLLSFIIYIPKIIAQVRADSRPRLFAYHSVVEKRTSNRLVHILAEELLVFYYAFFSWRKKPTVGITLHQGTSYMALQIMLIHSIVLESVGLHWWLHSKAPMFSIILLIINIYGLFFLIANLQAMRLNPIQTTDKGLYLSFGLMKQTYIEFDQIEEIIMDNEQLQLKKQKNRAEFICTEFEEVFPNVLLKMKAPQKIKFMYGFKKHYEYIAIKCDDPQKLIQSIAIKK